MWTCPKCRREFRRQGQDHYCGVPPKTVDQYIDAQEESAQPLLRELTELLRATVPDQTESIKWSMPSFQLGGGSLQFAACKTWVSLYVGADVLDAFRDSLEGWSYKKDALYLPYEKPLPAELIRRMLGWIGQQEAEGKLSQ